MAVDAYMAFIQFTQKPLQAESQVDLSGNTEVLATTGPMSLVNLAKAGQVFEIEDYSFDIEQTLNIGSQSMGTGAGKVTFNPFSITRKIDKCSPTFFQMACSGTPFQLVTLALRKSSGAGAAGAGNTAGVIYLRFDFKLVAVKTVSWSYDDEAPKETVTFEYGGLMVNYSQQNPAGDMMTPVAGGWNRVRNVQDTTTNLISAVA